MAVLTAAQKSTTAAIMALAANAAAIRSSAEVSVVLTAAQVINGWYIQTGTPGACNKTLPTAAAIVAAIKGCAVGTQFDFVVDNEGDNTITVLTGDGITLVGTATIANDKNRVIRFLVTDVDTPAIRALCLAALA